MEEKAIGNGASHSLMPLRKRHRKIFQVHRMVLEAFDLWRGREKTSTEGKER